MTFKVGITRDFGPGGELAGILDQPVRELLDGVPGIEWEFLAEYRPMVTADQVDKYDFVITGEPLWPAESFDGATRLTGVAYWGVGYNDIDVDAATKADVMVSITTPAVRRPMSESILTFMLALSKNLMIKDRITRAGRSEEKTLYNGSLIRGRVIGAIGLGNIGTDLLTLLKPLEPGRILVHDPFLPADEAEGLGVELTTLHELLRQADYVTVMCPLNDETRNMIGADEFRLMKESAFFINAARGGIVQQDALTEALRSGWIKGAALDVFAVEPPAADDPLLQMENVIVTSHCIGWTEELYHQNGVEDCRAALAVRAGQAPEYVVNRAVLKSPGLQAKLESYARIAS